MTQFTAKRGGRGESFKSKAFLVISKIFAVLKKIFRSRVSTARGVRDERDPAALRRSAGGRHQLPAERQLRGHHQPRQGVQRGAGPGPGQ